MFDKMHLKTFEPISDKQLLSRGYIRGHGDGQYRKLFRLQLSPSKIITVKTCPYWSSAGPSIELNPSKFDYWNEITDQLSTLVDQKFITIDRLDHAVDVPYSFRKIREKVRIARKHNIERYREKEVSKGIRLTGLVSGGKPEMVCIYDKAYDLSTRGKFKHIPGAKSGELTRIEVRHFGKKVPFSSLNDIGKYLDYDPFSRVEYYEIKEDVEHSDKLLRLRRDIQLVGFEGIYSELNESGNFKKSWGKYFEKKPFNKELTAIYQANQRKFYGEFDPE